ncbi:MAG: hypothetical protein KA785_07770 [Spirochaetaceae bacterium]|nr:hypothetical protein [Spirochaetaceae bacterium]
MADNKRCILILIILFLFVFLSAQDTADANIQTDDEEAQNYYLKKTEDGEEIFIQKLEWQYLEYVLRYEVELEIKKGDSFEPLVLLATEENFIEVTLTNGEYRYRVHVYNLLDRLDSTSDWISIVILKAEVPQIQSFSPRNFYLDETEDITVSINGINLKTDALYYFLPEDSSLLGRINGQVIEVNSDFSRLKISVNSDSFNEGRYTLHVKNPGGLESHIPGLQVQYQDPTDIYLSAGWAPGLFISELFQNISGNTGHLLSCNGRISPVFIKKSFGYFGAEVYGNFLHFAHEQEKYSIAGFFSNAVISALYQFPIIKKKFFIAGKIGAGVTFVHNVQYIYPNNAASPYISTMYINASTGIYAQYMITKNLFAALGADYLLVFGSENQVGNPIPSLVYPYINIGWKF